MITISYINDDHDHESMICRLLSGVQDVIRGESEAEADTWCVYKD